MQDIEAKRSNYYEVLGVERTASRGEIKSAFRRLAKKYRDEASGKGKDWYENRLAELSAAYKVLGNERERARYDAMLQTRGTQEAEEALERLRRRNYAMKLLSLLLDGKGSEALEIYDEMKESNFDLENFLSPKDYLDCIFLIGEQLEESERYEEAVQLYEYLFRCEQKPQRNRYFFDELEVRLKRLYSRVLPQLEGKTPEEELECYYKVLKFDLSRGEKAFIFKKIAESHLKADRYEKAQDAFREALELKPDLKGTTLIREELGPPFGIKPANTV